MNAPVRISLGERWRYPLLGCAARRLAVPAARGAAVAVVTPGHLGDVLHAVPMLKALRNAKPGTKIVWLVGPWSAALARRYAGYVDEVRNFGPNLPNYARGKREWRQSAWSQWRLALDLRRTGIDVLIAPLDGAGRFLANAVCPRTWIGIGDRRPPRVRPEIATVVQPYEKDRYEADAWCGLLEPLGIAARAERLVYEPTAAERQAADEFLRAEGVDPERPLAVIAPGSGWSGKNWLPARFAEVADWLVKEKGFQIAWVGGAGEEGLVPAPRRHDFNWVGRTSISLLAAVMERAQLFVGNDGGLLHFAAAQGVPTVSIWGPTSPGKWGPKGPRHRQIRKAERCDGCIYWDCRETCRHDRACMKAVATADVLAAVREVWRE
ncbi:MAG: glycosyltransferase family 9 protein [Spartobacteria bacterium]|nr:glycosyltransferase family 9 protein [Spartobacteria bacterium]